MGSRKAPVFLLLLLLASCLATGGTPEPGGGTPAAGLPAVPRMRPDIVAKTPSKGVPVAPTGANGGQQSGRGTGSVLPAGSGKPGAAGSGASGKDASRVAGTSAQQDDSGSVLPAASGKPGAAGTGASGKDASRVAGASAQQGGSGSVLPQATGKPGAAGTGASGKDASGVEGASGTTETGGSQPVAATGGSMPDEDGGSMAGEDGDAMAASGGGQGSGPQTQVAAVAPPPEDPGIDVESLFDGDVVRYCEAMWQMGEYIGVAWRRGESSKQSIGNAVGRIAAERQLPLDNRLSFSGQVYGRLVYRLEERHAAKTVGAYVHFACLTVRGDKKIVPADPNAERLLNEGLRRCENKAFTRDGLNDCIFRELTPIVDRRNE